MNTPYAWQTTTARAGTAIFDEGLRQHMLRVYNFMGLGLVVTGVVAYLVASTPALYVPIFQTPLKWVVMLAPLGFVFFLSTRVHAMSASAAQMTFWAFAAVMKKVRAMLVPVKTRNTEASDRPITAQKVQNSACAVPAEIA